MPTNQNLPRQKVRENIYLIKTKHWSKTSKRWLNPIYFEIMKASTYKHLLARFGHREKIVNGEFVTVVIVEIKMMLTNIAKNRPQPFPNRNNPHVHTLEDLSITETTASIYGCRGCTLKFPPANPLENVVMHMCKECFTMYCQDCVLKIMNNPSNRNSVRFAADSKYQPMGLPYAFEIPK